MIDITRFSLEAIAVWIVAFFVMEFPMRQIYLNMEEKGFLQRWYGFREFNPTTVIIGDLFYVLIGIIIAYRIHEYFFKDVVGTEKRFLYFFLIFLIVQIIGDITFYFSLLSLPQNYKNKWVQFFIDYGNSAKLNAVLGDSIYIFVWTITTYFVSFIPIDFLLMILFFFIFLISIISN
jgi:hypothetical protein